jgi:hypothetical protein
MPKKEPIESKMQKHLVRVHGRLSGTLKNNYLNDLRRGYSENELVKAWARFYYSHPDRPKDV